MLCSLKEEVRMANDFKAGVEEWVAENLPGALVGVDVGMYGV